MVQTEEIRLIRYLLYLSVQIKGKIPVQTNFLIGGQSPR